MDVGVALAFAAFIAYIIAAVVLAKLYGPDKARELLEVTREAVRDISEAVKQSVEAVKEVAKVAYGEEEEGE